MNSRTSDVATHDRSGLRRLGGAYEETRARIEDLVAELDEQALAQTVPACPEWSVRDVVAHLSGVCADIIAGNLTGVASDEWTAKQVGARRGRPFVEIIAEWDEVGPQVASVVDDFPGRYGDQLVADINVHEHDLRGTLKRPDARASDGVSIGIDFLVTVILHSGVCEFGLPPLEVRAGEQGWIVGGTQARYGDPEAAIQASLISSYPAPSAETVPAGSVMAERFEMFRALTGRRSAAQIHDFRWTVDPGPYLSTFGSWPFTVRTEDLIE